MTPHEVCGQLIIVLDELGGEEGDIHCEREPGHEGSHRGEFEWTNEEVNLRFEVK